MVHGGGPSGTPTELQPGGGNLWSERVRLDQLISTGLAGPADLNGSGWTRWSQWVRLDLISGALRWERMVPMARCSTGPGSRFRRLGSLGPGITGGDALDADGPLGLGRLGAVGLDGRQEQRRETQQIGMNRAKGRMDQESIPPVL